MSRDNSNQTEEKMRLCTKDHRIGIFKGKHFYKLQLGRFRLYLSFIPMKPKYESSTRRSFRQQLLERSGKCAVCGKQLSASTLSVHHVIPRSERPDLCYDPGNCLCMCKQCHSEYHRADNMAKARTPVAV